MIQIDDLCQLCGKSGHVQPGEVEVYRETFGKKAPPGVSFVCESCYQKLTAAYPASHWEEDIAAGIVRPIILGSGGTNSSKSRQSL